MESQYSINPDGEKFLIPGRDDYEKELSRIKEIVNRERSKGREIIVVMGIGFVGAVMAAVVADSVDEKGKSNKFVFGLDLPSPRSYWKIEMLNRGQSPVKAEDPEVEPLIKRCVNEKKTLLATFHEDVLSFADTIVVDIQCDYIKESLGDISNARVDMEALEKSFYTIGERISPETLVLIETTVPPGTTEQVAYPIIKKTFEKRKINKEPLLAHSFERVMPGKNYVASIKDFWRVCSGTNEEAKQRVVKFK